MNIVIVSKTIVTAKVADPLLSIEPFISDNDPKKSDVIHSKNYRDFSGSYSNSALIMVRALLLSSLLY